MPMRTVFRNDFPRLSYAVLGALIGTSALFNPVSHPAWEALNVFVIVGSLGLAFANTVGLIVRRRRRKRPLAEVSDQ